MVARRKVRGAMNFRLSAAISFVLLVGVSSAMCAQQAKTPALDEILERLEANLNHYDKSLPSLFCDEHVVSRMDPGVGDTVDSIFRVKRSENPDHTMSLAESRELQTVDGRPATSQSMMGFPSVLSGAFEGGFAVVSLSQKACMKYTRERTHGNGPDEPYIVDFAAALPRENHEGCLLQEKSKGRVFIDRASMQITHLEMTTPHHVINRGSLFERPVLGKWAVTIDYAPVVLDGDTFWMPSAIMSRAVSTSEGFHATTWTFEATYRNYHRLEVKSRILPSGGAVVK